MNRRPQFMMLDHPGFTFFFDYHSDMIHGDAMYVKRQKTN